MLSVRDNRRTRSKSPGGRERDRSHSRDTRAKSPPRKESRKSNKKYSESSSDDSDPRHRDQNPPKKYYQSDSEDDKRRQKNNSKKYSESGSEESDRHRLKSSSKKYYESDSDDHKYTKRPADKKLSSRRDVSDAELDPRKDKSRGALQKYYESDSSAGSPRHSHSHALPVPSSKPRDDRYDSSRHANYAQPAPSSSKPRDGVYENERHASYAQPVQPSSKPRDDGFDNDRHSSYAQPVQLSSKPRDDGYDSGRHASYAKPGPSSSNPRDDRYDGGRHASYAQPPPSSQSTQYGYPPANPYIPSQPTAPEYHGTRHMSYAPPKASPSISAPPSNPHYTPPTQEYAPPGAFPLGHSDDPRDHRVHSVSVPTTQKYVPPAPYQYAQLDQNSIAYKPATDKQYVQSHEQQYVKPAYSQSQNAQFVEISPGAKHDYKQDHLVSPQSPGISSRTANLAIGGGLGATLAAANHNPFDGGRPPASPLLEAYRGTYQSISPMPSPMMHAKSHKHDDSDLSDLELSDSDGQRQRSSKRDLGRNGRKHRPSNADAVMISPTTARKRVSFYDPTDDAKKIAAALAGTHHAPNTKPLISILPALSTEDILALRAEYKNFAKVAGKGINMAKHIKTRVPGNLGKATYATALGRWESEAYWANSWYQGGASRRELLIESLMGRSNSDIREIKNCFKDKRYGDDLETCMKAELKADKFRTAVLLALEEIRMSDSQPLEIELIRKDVLDLYKALTSREGGETAMIKIIVVRSDSHLREVLHVFERTYQRNFARDMISKSKNLVGETLAHILNGALNRPMRDALLLHQAISETAPGKERAELLISRLVRMHWEPRHLERVKTEYLKRYHSSVETSIKKDVVDIVKGEEAKQWGEFCIELAKSSGSSSNSTRR